MTAEVRVPLRERVPFGRWGPLGVAVDPATWRAVPYLLGSIVLGGCYFAALVFAIPVSMAFTVIGVGVPMLVLTMVLWRSAAMLERRLVRWSFGVDLPDPYRPRPRRGFWNHVGWLFGDPATWKDLGYLLLLFPVGLVEFVASVLFWYVSLILICAPIPTVLGSGWVILGELRVDTLAEAVPVTVLGLALLFTGLYAIRGLAWLHAALARLLLGADETRTLEAKADRLRASRARGVDAAETERRRIERDLHDGAQQRLLAVALDLGRAQAKMDADPAAARELLASAHAGTKAAIAELRDLARGIYPAILTDRGLDAALSSLAGRAPVRVDVSVEITDRPPAAVESIAYFIVAESLSNMAKHAAATEARVHVSRQDLRVVVEVADNGIGGAALVPGGGLAGLADRAATIDGILTVNSPRGGPTLIRAELPCTW
ncbi:histidine kinase [Acrocarpospora phusangensis]|uniref:histidine kinase n=1 Tax=Acrocarpospora phusangensis TaxID=1070424 RepID=A0A919QN24_9ACTN|nr:sensor histidine kinase [Acrocarpospora phusangensis]GIH29275.1 histidine kinase [Acrocarpospora phusangensis]